MEPEKKEKVEADVKSLLQNLGLDITDEHLVQTPKRVAKMFDELFSGLKVENEPKFTTFKNPDYNQIIVVKGKFHSMCSHHLLPFIGTFWFGYIPNELVCGLSKIPRVVEYFAKRPQLQERLSEQVIEYLNEKLNPLGCILIMKAKHYCEILRGVRQDESVADTITSAVRGVFLKEPEGKHPKEEFLKLIDLT